MYNYLDFVKDKDFERCIAPVMEAYGSHRHEDTITDFLLNYENGTDEFKLLFDMYGTQSSLKEWRQADLLRRSDTKVSMRIGDFHQKLLGSVDGWSDLGTGHPTKVDLMKDDETIFIELKNKENTVNYDSASKVRDKLEKIREDYPDSIACFAFIVSKGQKYINTVWEIGERDYDDKILKISGNRLYEMVTGHADGIYQTFNAVNNFLKDRFGDDFVGDEDSQEINKFTKEIFSRH